MKSSPETSPHPTGAHRAHRRAPRSVARFSSERYEPYLDGMFTYCLSVLCDHDKAVTVLGEVLAIAERQYGRGPADAGKRRAWLYALARWACRRALAEQRRTCQGSHAAARDPRPLPAETAETAERRRGELALLAWPEAAGTTPEQREMLELAVRHQLGPHDVAAVLSLELMAARELLASAACEVERTRAALSVVERGDCPSVARLSSDRQVLLSAVLRRELVRHVDDCPRCRRAAEQVQAAGPWPGAVRPDTTSGTAGVPGDGAPLPVLEAPRDALLAAMARGSRARGAAPRFGRDGFPMEPRDRAARRDRLRARAVTSTVVATVVAAPVLALWAAYRGAPETGEGRDGSRVSARQDDSVPGRHGIPADTEDRYGHVENAGNARDRPGADFTARSRRADVSVEVISVGPQVPPVRSGLPVPGRISVTARTAGGTTAITLTAAGSTPVSWSARTGADWLRLSRTSGTLAPGESVVLRVLVDHDQEPAGPWTARIVLRPSGSVVKIDGYGWEAPVSDEPGDPVRPGHTSRPHRPGHHGHGRPGHGHHGRPGPGPSRPGDPGSSEQPGQGTEDPGDPGPMDPTPSDPTPSDPPPSDPPPSDPGPSDPPGQDPSAPGSPDPGTQDTGTPHG